MNIVPMTSRMQMKIIKFISSLIQIAILALVFSPAHAQQIPRELTKILALGDSITEGFSRTTSAESYRLPLTSELDNTACNYEMVGRRLANRPATGFFSRHEGYSGHAIDYFLEARGINPGIEAIITDADPDVVLIHLGSNDLNLGQTVASTVNDLVDLTDRIFNVKSDVQIYLANVIPWFGISANSNISQDISGLGTAITNWVNNSNNSQLHLVDVRSGFTIAEMQPDGIHPNAEGDARIADAFLTAIHSNNDCPTPPETIIVSPIDSDNEENNFVRDLLPTTPDSLPASHRFTGSAIDLDGDGIARVRIAIEDNNHTNSSNQWFNFAAGQFGTFSETVATLSNVTPTSASWSIDVTLPSGGDYQFYALAVDNFGNQNYFDIGVWPVNTPFSTFADTQAPGIVIETPTNTVGPTLPSNATFSGVSFDPGGSGFNDIRISLFNVTQNTWYDFDSGGFTDSTVITSANLSNTTTNFTNWSFSVDNLPAATYRVFAQARDNAGNDSVFLGRTFNVLPQDLQAPGIVIQSPSNTVGPTLPSNATLSGVSFDAGGSGFNDIRISLFNVTQNTWYDFNSGGFTNSTVITSANLSNTTTNFTNWSFSVNSLPAATYRVFAQARDNAGNDSVFIGRSFNVLPQDSQAPGIVIQSPTNTVGPILPSNATLSGVSFDAGGSGFNDIRISLFNVTQNTWYDFNSGGFTNSTVITSANLSNTTTNFTNWSFSVNSLPAATYRVFAQARDNAGNDSVFMGRSFNVLP